MLHKNRIAPRVLLFSIFLDTRHYVMDDGSLVIFNVAQSGKFGETSHLSYTCQLQNSITGQTKTSQPFLLGLYFDKYI